MRLWRPVMTRTYDAGNEAATRKVTLHQFNHMGKTTFESYALRNANYYKRCRRWQNIVIRWAGTHHRNE